MNERKVWTYGIEIQNRNYLKDEQSFDELAQEIEAAVRESSVKVTRYHMEPPVGAYSGDDPLLERLQCIRPRWWIELKPVLLDKLYNGLMGIRAQYYESPYHGLRMNQMLLSRLTDPLIKLAAEIDPTTDSELLHLSLSKPSAKVWISEKDKYGNKIIRASGLELTVEEIQNDWLDIAKDVKSGKYNDQYQLYSASINGVRAPIADQLEVKGAWLTSSDRCEYVTPDKRNRDCQIFLFGFT